MLNLQIEGDYPKTSARGTMKNRVNSKKFTMSEFLPTSTNISVIKEEHISRLNDCTASRPSGYLGSKPALVSSGISLSREEQEALRPPSPVLLLQAKQDRPHFPGIARLARVYKINNDIGVAPD